MNTKKKYKLNCNNTKKEKIKKKYFYMKNYYTDLIGKELYDKIMYKYNLYLDLYANNTTRYNFSKIINYGIIGAFLDIVSSKPCHYDSFKNRKQYLTNGLKLFDNVRIKNIAKNYYKIKDQLDIDGVMENKLVTNLCINLNKNSNEYGEIYFLGNWENPIGNNSNCLRELLTVLKSKENIQEYDNLNNKNLENEVTDLDDDYYESTEFENIIFDEKYYKNLDDYILVIVNGKSIREEPNKFNFLKGDIYFDFDFFKNIPKKKVFENQYYTKERGYNSLYHLYKYT